MFFPSTNYIHSIYVSREYQQEQAYVYAYDLLIFLSTIYIYLAIQGRIQIFEVHAIVEEAQREARPP